MLYSSQYCTQRSSAMACSGFPCFMLFYKSNSNFVSLLNVLPLYSIGDVGKSLFTTSLLSENLVILHR